jgi:histidinol-phosphate aminotransferase
LGLPFIPSHTNFVLFEVPRDASEIRADLSEQGIQVRSFRIQQKDWIRVSIGTPAEMQGFASALAGVI